MTFDIWIDGPALFRMGLVWELPFRNICPDGWTAPRTQRQWRETYMRYAQTADAIPHISSTMLVGKSHGTGAGCERDFLRSGTNAPIRIFTLGRFCIAIEGHATCSGGKASHRPLS